MNLSQFVQPSSDYQTLAAIGDKGISNLSKVGWLDYQNNLAVGINIL